MSSIEDTNTAIRAALRIRYPLPECALFFEVPNSTGAVANRRVDAMSVGCWPSRGMAIDGFEIKATKYDWRREKGNPQKAEDIARYCDFWWLATGPGVVGDPSEIPERWGWMELLGDRLMLRKQAPKLEAAPLDRPFMASLLRTAGYVDKGLVQKAVDEARKRDTDRFEEEVQHRVKRLAEQAERAQKVFGPLFDILDDDATAWVADDTIAAAVRAVLKSGAVDAYGGLRHIQKTLQDAADKVGAAADTQGVPQPTPERRPRRRI